MVAIRMKLAVSCFCVLHVAFVSAGLLTRNGLQSARSNLSGSKALNRQSSGSLNHNRQRQGPLFARRGQYEQQRIHLQSQKPQKPKDVPVPDLPKPTTKVAAKPVSPSCSRLAQTCLPQTGCCDPCALCHCRFFNAICFCRKMNLLYGTKT